MLTRLLVCSVLLAAACSAPAAESGTTLGSATASSAGGTSTTTGPGPFSTTTGFEETTTTSGRPVAPDFTLELGEGGQYVLSQGARPVYLVFWAEW